MRENKGNELNTLENKLTRTEHDVYKLLDKIDSLTLDTIDKFVIQKIEREVENISSIISKYINRFEILKKKAIDNAVDKLEAVGNDAVALFRLSSSKFFIS